MKCAGRAGIGGWNAAPCAAAFISITATMVSEPSISISYLLNRSPVEITCVRKPS